MHRRRNTMASPFLSSLLIHIDSNHILMSTIVPPRVKMPSQRWLNPELHWRAPNWMDYGRLLEPRHFGEGTRIHRLDLSDGFKNDVSAPRNDLPGWTLWANTVEMIFSHVGHPRVCTSVSRERERPEEKTISWKREFVSMVDAKSWTRFVHADIRCILRLGISLWLW